MKHTTRKLVGIDSSYSMVGWFRDKPFDKALGRGTWREFSLWASSTPGKVDVAFLVAEGNGLSTGLREVYPLAEGDGAFKVFAHAVSQAKT